MVVTVSSGIGSKIFDAENARGVIDDLPYAGEIGHAKADESDDPPACDCGGKGHLGAIASGSGILRYAKRLAAIDSAFLKSMCAEHFGATPGSLTNEDHLVPAAQVGDPWALNVVRHCTVPLARVLLETVLAIGVERIVVIGGFALSLGNAYASLLREEMPKRCDYRVVSFSLKDLVILGDNDACLLGAPAYASRCCNS